MERAKNDFLATQPIGKLIAKFGIPCVISLLVNALYNIVDQIFIGRDPDVGYLGNGATNVIFPVTVIAMAFALLLGDGAAAFLSLKLGAGDKKTAEKGVNNFLIMLVVCAVVILVTGILFLEKFVMFFAATDEIFPYAMAYGRIIVAGLPFVMITTGLNSIIRADGSPNYAMASMITGAVLNTILDPIFIFVFKMGVQGAAIATIIGQIASFILCIIYIPRLKSVKVSRQNLRFDWKIARKVAALGISSFITQMAITAVIAVTNNMLKLYGDLSVYGPNIPLAAFGIVMKVNQIMISMLVGIAVGAQPIVGYNYGAGNYARVKKTFGITITLATIIASVCFICFFFFNQYIINIFGSEDALYNEFAQKCFRTFLLLCICNGFQIVSGIFFQAIGKPVKAGVLSLSRQIGFLVPAALLLPLALGVEGVLWAGPVADGLAFLLALILIILQMRKLTVKENEKIEAGT